MKNENPGLIIILFKLNTAIFELQMLPSNAVGTWHHNINTIINSLVPSGVLESKTFEGIEAAFRDDRRTSFCASDGAEGLKGFN